MRLQFEGSLAAVRQEMQEFLGGPVVSIATPALAESKKEKKETPAAESAPVAVAPTLQTVKELVSKLVAKVGKDKTKQLVTVQFAPATTPSEIAVERYAEFVVKANELLK
jgi:hypothetical protein